MIGSLCVFSISVHAHILEQVYTFLQVLSHAPQYVVMHPLERILECCPAHLDDLDGVLVTPSNFLLVSVSTAGASFGAQAFCDADEVLLEPIEIVLLQLCGQERSVR